MVVRRKHIDVAVNIVFIDISRLRRLGSVAQRVCPKIDTQHDHILIDLEVSVYEMRAESMLGKLGERKAQRGIMADPGNFRLPAVIFQVVIPVPDRKGSAIGQYTNFEDRVISITNHVRIA